MTGTGSPRYLNKQKSNQLSMIASKKNKTKKKKFKSINKYTERAGDGKSKKLLKVPGVLLHRLD